MKNLTSANDKSFDIKEKTNLRRKLEDRKFAATCKIKPLKTLTSLK
jgi:hypothetical protein